jgi:ACS family allantoate permease-like MFS transporter
MSDENTEKFSPNVDDVEKDLGTKQEEDLPDAKVHSKQQATENVIGHQLDADEALRAFESLNGEVITIDAETNKRLLRIIDWHLMPLMCLVYGMNYLDSTFYSSISLMSVLS